MPLPLVITMEAVSAMLRRTLPGIMEAGVFLAIGFGTLILYRLRSAQRDRGLLWFGLFSTLYGVRLLAESEAVGTAVRLPELVWAFTESLITYVILLPVVLLIRELLPTWEKALRIVFWIMAAFAVAGVVSDIVQVRPKSLSVENSAIVLLALGTFLIALFRQRGNTPDIRALRIGMLVFAFTIAVNNLSGVFDVSRPFDFEPLGLLVFLVSLGRVLAARAYRNQERLLELDKELDVARRIQMSILPHQMPTGPQWDIDARYVPMTAVAGDFYDFFVLDEQRIGILVADVSGHGVPAALIASMVKVAFAAELPHAASPSQVLCGINRTLCGKLQGQYVTAAYLYLDLAARKMRYAAAAHPALFWSRAEGDTEQLLENGLMLGLFTHAEYTEQEKDIQPGDRFLLYTDGLLEAANRDGEFFGEIRAEQILREEQRQPAHSLLSSLVRHVSEWSHPAQDDLTLVAVGWQLRNGG